MEIIKGKRYSFYMEDGACGKQNKVSALFTGDIDKNNGNLLFVQNNLWYSIPKEDVFKEKNRQ